MMYTRNIRKQKQKCLVGGTSPAGIDNDLTDSVGRGGELFKAIAIVPKRTT